MWQPVHECHTESSDLETTVSSGLRHLDSIRDIVFKREDRNNFFELSNINAELNLKWDNQPVSHFACPTHSTLGPGVT